MSEARLEGAVCYHSASKCPSDADTSWGRPDLTRRSDMAQRTCSIEDCTKPARSRGWCPMHYTRWKRHGDPLAMGEWPSTPPLERLLRHVDASGDCWEWTGYRSNLGYGVSSGKGIKSRQAHRALWLELVGPIVGNLDLDHLCRNRGCVNPDHLEPVTRRENMRRGIRWSAPRPVVCENEGCDRDVTARGLCMKHYCRQRKAGAWL
jgi:hypothetical protein